MLTLNSILRRFGKWLVSITYDPGESNSTPNVSVQIDATEPIKVNHTLSEQVKVQTIIAGEESQPLQIYLEEGTVPHRELDSPSLMIILGVLFIYILGILLILVTILS